MITIARFDKIPFLVHGFGDSALSVSGLKRLFPRSALRAVALHQVHSDTVHFVDGAARESRRGDALVSRTPGLLLVIKTADCLPVLLVDEGRRVIAAVHCGWRGTVHRVLEKAVRGMRARYGCDPGRLLAAFGPCIGAGCYEVGEDVRGRFLRAGFSGHLFRPVPDRPGQHLFDLAAANRLQLLEGGVDERNIFAAGVCTHCDPLYPSYRRDAHRSGRMLSFIGLLPPSQNQRG
jgi:purine-nucleoside/S-methyl-5'-thioadenosine phosphorylase / adenosine deaminase